MIILDTNVLIDRDLFEFEPEERYAASILSRAEFEFGICAAKTPELRAERVARLAALDSEFDWLQFDIDCTRSYGIIAAGATSSGIKGRNKDALLAAQVHRFGASVMTENIDDFTPFCRFISIVKPSLRSR